MIYVIKFKKKLNSNSNNVKIIAFKTNIEKYQL